MRCAHIEAKFYEEVHDLERKYAALYQPLFDKVGRSLCAARAASACPSFTAPRCGAEDPERFSFKPQT